MSKLLMTQLELEISNPCNEHCVHCYRHCLNTKKGFLTVEQAEKALIQAKKLGANEVIISGGEALLNPDWKEIVKLADNMNYKISILSNGILLTEQDADFLANVHNLCEVQISIYSLEDSIHDSITNVSGSCYKTKNAIKFLRQRNIPVFLSIPAMQSNKDSFYKVMSWADEQNIKSCSDLFIFGTSDYKKANLSQRLTFSDLEDFFKITMQNNGSLSYVWGNGYGQRDLEKINFYGGATTMLCVSGDGSIYPSIGWYEKLGNIEKDSLEDIFTNNLFLKKIRKIKANDFEKCRNCTDADFCDFCPYPHLTANNGELDKLDEEFCKYVHLRKDFAKKRDSLLAKISNH